MAGLTKGQLAVIANQGAVAFGPDAEPPPPPRPEKRPPARTGKSLRSALANP